LREFIERYNRQAQENGSKVISYQYARVMSRIGNKMIAEGLRMTVDFPALSPSYYVAALDAKDFASALNHAQEAVTAHQARPQEVPKYTIRAFKDELHPDRASRRTQSRQTPETINQASVVASPATASVETAEEEQEPAPKPVGATCYDCRYCWQPHDYHRLAVVNTKGSAAIDLMMEPVPVWICRKHKTVISVRTQVYARAEALARSCPNYQRVEINLEPPERESSHDGDMESGDDVGLVVGPEELDAALEEVS
jgi:heterodisulfide reductase subunit A-like polyferredoxin